MWAMLNNLHTETKKYASRCRFTYSFVGAAPRTGCARRALGEARLRGSWSNGVCFPVNRT